MVGQFSDTGRFIAFLIWICWTPIFFVGIVLFTFRRDRYPIKQRQPFLLTISAIGGYWIMTSYCWEIFVLSENFPCVLSHWLVWIAYPCYFLPYPLRAFRLIFIFKLNWFQYKQGLLEEKSNDAQPTTTTREASFFSRFRWYMLHMEWVLGIVIAFTFIVGIIRQFAIKENLPPNTGCQNSVLFFISSLVFFLIFEIALITAIWFLRGVRDEFNISNELKTVGLTWTIALITYLIINLVATIQSEGFVWWSVYFVLLWTIVSHITSIGWPVYRTFYETPTVEWLDVEAVSTCEKLLQNDLCLRYFKEFLVVDFSVENLIFWLDVRAFKKIENNQTMLERAIEIYDKFFLKDSPFQLNLDDVVVAPIKKTMKEAKEQMEASSISPDTLALIPTIFDEAQLFAFDLMATTSFFRFKKHQLCKELVSKLQVEEERKKTIDKLNLL